MSDKTYCFNFQSAALEMLDGKRICPSCNGSGKEEVTFMYDNSDNKLTCHNMLKQIDLVSRGCLCHECDGEGKVDVPMWNWERNAINKLKKEFFDKIYKGDVLTDLYRNRIREEQYKMKYIRSDIKLEKSDMIIES